MQAAEESLERQHADSVDVELIGAEMDDEGARRLGGEEPLEPFRCAGRYRRACFTSMATVSWPRHQTKSTSLPLGVAQ